MNSKLTTIATVFFVFIVSAFARELGPAEQAHIETAISFAGFSMKYLAIFAGVILICTVLVKTCGYLAMAAFVFFLNVIVLMSVT
jgi:hypothetical protein